MASAGWAGTLGTVISGALTGLASWRWIFYINIPVVLFALLMVPRLLSEGRMAREGHRIDVAGAVTATRGLVAVVDGLLQAASHPWASWQVLGYSPLRTGLLYLPLGIGIGAGIGLATGLMPRIGVKAMLALGFLGSAAGLLIASYIHVNSSYAGGILPGLVVFGVFSGVCYPGLINGALHQVTGQDSGLDSGVQTAMQQVGSALGLATLVTLALRYALSPLVGYSGSAWRPCSG